MLSLKWQKIYERKLQRFSEHTGNKDDDIEEAKQIIYEMSAKVLTEYPKTISKECMNEITERNKGRDTCLEFGNELAKKHDMQDWEEKVKIEQKKWIDEDRFYRSADNLIQEIEQNGKSLIQYY